MSRYIEVNDVANAIYHHIPSIRTMADARGIIEEAPSIDIEPKRGEWIDAEEDWRHQIVFWRCSECGYAVSTMYNFCPKCGADMRERKENK